MTENNSEVVVVSHRTGQVIDYYHNTAPTNYAVRMYEFLGGTQRFVVVKGSKY